MTYAIKNKYQLKAWSSKLVMPLWEAVTSQDPLGLLHFQRQLLFPGGYFGQSTTLTLQQTLPASPFKTGLDKMFCTSRRFKFYHMLRWKSRAEHLITVSSFSLLKEIFADGKSHFHENFFLLEKDNWDELQRKLVWVIFYFLYLICIMPTTFV